MVKVLIAEDIHTELRKESSFLDRTDVRVFPVATNDELLRIHRAERADIIITRLNLPGMISEELFSRIREDKGLRFAPVIMVCSNNPVDIAGCARCGASAVILRPVQRALLLARAQQFLAFYAREGDRVPLNAEVYAAHGSRLVKCRSRDIAASGMLIEAEEEFKRGDRLVLSFSLPGSERIRAEAEIVSVQDKPPKTSGNRYGLRFTGLAAETKQLLQAFVEERNRVAA